MNYPSTEFGDAVSRLCDAATSDEEVPELHALLRSNPAALDAYLWQVELHARLAQMAMRAEMPLVFHPNADAGHRLLAPVHTNGLRFAVIGLVVLAGGVASWFVAHSHENQNRIVKVIPRVSPATAPAPATSDKPNAMAGMQNEGIYRETVRFAIAADAPVIVGTGKSEPVQLGAEVPYSQGGDTLNIWDWSKSPMSRVMKDVRLWPQDQFAVSPDGKALILASGKIIDLTTGQQSAIDLGGEFYFDDIGGSLRRIQELQFTPDGQHLALRLCNVVLTPSTHPLRGQDFSTTQSIQIITFPVGKLVCEFPAGLTLAFSRDGRRAFTSIPHYEERQQIIEHNASTGQIIRKYEPRLRGFAYAIDLSPDGSRLAAYDSEGDLLLWDTATGALKHRVHVKGGATTQTLGFSPDGKLVAISLISKTSVIDAASGAIMAVFEQQSPGLIRWSADSRSFDVISNVTTVGISERADHAGQLDVYNIFPALKKWNLVDMDKK